MSTPKCTSHELKILGDFWTLEIIQTLADGEKRFSQIERDLPTINPTTLTTRLKKLKDQKMISFDIGYKLTAKGQGVLPILKTIKSFAQKYL